MSAILIDAPPLNRWNENRIQPGPVGSVGDALTAVRLQQSAPSLPIKYSQTFSATNSKKRGSNVQDGNYASYCDGGYNATVVKEHRKKKQRIGYIIQNISGNDRAFDSVVAPQPRVGTITQAEAILHRQGDAFQVLPGGYGPEPGQLLRGGQVPRVVDLVQPVASIPTLGVNGGGQSAVNEPNYPVPPELDRFPFNELPPFRRQRIKGREGEADSRRNEFRKRSGSIIDQPFSKFRVLPSGSDSGILPNAKEENTIYDDLIGRIDRLPDLSTQKPVFTGLKLTKAERLRLKKLLV